MAAGSGTVTVKILGDASSLKSALNESDSALSSFSNKMKDVGGKITAVGAKMTAGVTLPIVGVGTAAFEMASDLNESLSKATVVFGDFSDGIIELGDRAATSLGMSRQAAIEAASTFGNLFRTMGMGKPEAAKMSSELVQLSADLASFNNQNPEDVLLALKSGLIGEAEPMRQFGVLLTEASVKAKALEMGLGDANGELTEGEKVQARYALILEQTKTAQGDFARTADGAANKQRILKAEFEDTAAVIGQKLMPIGMKILEWVGKLATAFTDLSPHMQDMVLIGAALAAAIGPLTTIIGGLVTVVGALISPVALAVLGIGALVAAIIYAYTQCETFRDAVDGFIDIVTELGLQLKDFLTPIIQFIAQHTDEFRVAAIALGVVLGGALMIAIGSLTITIGSAIAAITLIVAAVFAFIDALEWLWEKAEPVRQIIGDIAVALGNALAPSIATVVSWLQALWEKAQAVGSFLADTFRTSVDAGRAAIDALRGAFDAVAGAIQFVIDKVQWLIDKIPSIPSLPNLGFGDTGWTNNVQGKISGAKAGGGPVGPGAWLVGERGPEILTMGGNGFVTPNNALGGFTIGTLVLQGVQTESELRRKLIRNAKRNGRDPVTGTAL